MFTQALSLLQGWKNYILIGVFALLLFMKFCNKPTQVILAQDARIDTLTNSLSYALSVQNKLRDSLEFIALIWKNKQPQIISDLHKTVNVYDTVRSKLFIVDTFRREQHEIVTVIDTQFAHVDTSYYLRLPYSYALQDTFIKLRLSISNYKKSIDSLTIINALSIKNTKTNSFFYETRNLSFENSNPYISNVTPIYVYRVQNARKTWADRLGGFLLGLGTGYLIKSN